MSKIKIKSNLLPLIMGMKKNLVAYIKEISIEKQNGKLIGSDEIIKKKMESLLIIVLDFISTRV